MIFFNISIEYIIASKRINIFKIFLSEVFNIDLIILNNFLSLLSL